ncbi:MAG TPA: alkaline phosphatase family protein [Gemmatimonadaceae bacterium]|nr:alkaline phosphatase family protein [Gemmatimonadaceae bacterium]
MQRPMPVLALAVACALGACDAPTSTRAPAAVQRVVLVSVDGLRGDALAAMPSVAALAARGAWTDSMTTVAPAITVPAHVAMITGRDVTALGLRGNQLDSAAVLALVFAGASTVFDWTRGAGGTSHAVVGASLVPPELRAEAQLIFGVDSLSATDASAAEIATRAVEIATRPAPPTLLFVHFADADAAGHTAGWIAPGADHDVLAPGYLAALREVDGAIARLWDVAAADVEAGRLAFIVTADHGGGHGDGCVDGVPAYREHCTLAHGDRLIPFVLVARGVAAGRLTAGGRITQVGPTVGALLGTWRPRAADGPVEYPRAP